MEVETPKSRTRLDEDRLATILDVATEVFIQKGFAAASTNEIARLANASKGTFYSRFPNKEALFLAVLSRRMESVFHQVADSLPPDPPIEETLREFSTRFVDIALSKEQLSLLRVVTMEAQHFPQVGERFYELGPKRGQEAVTAYMRSQIKLGRLIAEDPEAMAQQYLSVLGGGPIRWAILGVRPWPMHKEELKAHVEGAMRFFLRAYQVKPPAPAK